MKIEIKILSNIRAFHLKMNTDKNETYLNSCALNVDANKLATIILEIVKDWPMKSSKLRSIDGESYMVLIENLGQTRKYEGKNNFPENYSNLIKLLETL